MTRDTSEATLKTFLVKFLTASLLGVSAVICQITLVDEFPPWSLQAVSVQPYFYYVM
jgi:hypothetical protein